MTNANISLKEIFNSNENVPFEIFSFIHNDLRLKFDYLRKATAKIVYYWNLQSNKTMMPNKKYWAEYNKRRIALCLLSPLGVLTSCTLRIFLPLSTTCTVSCLAGYSIWWHFARRTSLCRSIQALLFHAAKTVPKSSTYTIKNKENIITLLCRLLLLY